MLDNMFRGGEVDLQFPIINTIIHAMLCLALIPRRICICMHSSKRTKLCYAMLRYTMLRFGTLCYALACEHMRGVCDLANTWRFSRSVNTYDLKFTPRSLLHLPGGGLMAVHFPALERLVPRGTSGLKDFCAGKRHFLVTNG